jgi:YHS domain-containing protein
VLRALLLFLFFLFVARAVWRLVEGVARGAMGEGAPAPGPGRRGPAAPAAVKMTPCPVCGTYVVPDKAVTGVSKGKIVHFCSDACRATFAA